MQWLKLDSQVAGHPKILALDDPSALLLWMMTLVGCSRHETDGRVEPHMLKRFGVDAYVTTPAKLRAATRRIVNTGLWHDATTIHDCGACCAEFGDTIPRDLLVVHNWNDWNPNRADKTDETKAMKANRRRQLKKLPRLKEEIRQRDRDYCRYCGIRVNMSDHVSHEGGQLDHIDPDGPNTLENLVRSCRGCNMYRKGERTPDEAGMEMLPAPKPGQAPPVAPWRRLEHPFGDPVGTNPKYPERDAPRWWEALTQPPPAPVTPEQIADLFDVPAELVFGPDDPSSDPGPDPGSDPGSTPARPEPGPPSDPGSDPVLASRSARVGSEPGRDRVGPRVGSRVGTGLGLGLLGTARGGADRCPPLLRPATSGTTPVSPSIPSPATDLENPPMPHPLPPAQPGGGPR